LLTDFGLNRVCQRWPKPGRKGGTEWSSTFCGTMPYMAPEILMTVNIFYDPFPADIWALGIILFILFNSGYPLTSTINTKCWNSSWDEELNRI
jgi:serine/threonine protein kinase